MKGLDWSNEAYVRVYRSDSPLWNVLGFEAQALYLMTQRKLDAAGVLSLGGLSPVDAIYSFFPGADRESIARALDQLLERGFLLHDAEEEKLVDPEFLERETASKSDRQRQRESRERRRHVTFRDGKSQPVTAGHGVTAAVTAGHDAPRAVTANAASGGGVTNRDPSKGNVTESHDRSQAVTSCHSLPLPLPQTLSESQEKNPQRRRVGRIQQVFADNDRALPNRSIGAWAKRLARYAEHHDDLDAACDALVADLESIAAADKLLSSAYALKIIDGQLEQQRTGQGIYRPRARRRRPDAGAHPETLRAAAELD